MHSHLHSLALAALLFASCSSAPAFTIPVPLPEALDWARAEALEGGTFLGLKTRENDGGSLDDLVFEPGVRVVRVIESSPAAAAGMRVGDVLLGWGGSQVDDPAALETLVQRTAPGTEVRARVQRADTVFEVPITLRAVGAEAGAEVEVLYRRDPARSAAGWVTGGGGALLVASADEGPFPAAGVDVGSVVLAIDGTEVLSARALIRRLQALPAGARVEVDFRRADGTAGSAEVELFDAGSVVTGAQIPILFNYSRDVERDTSEFALIDLWFISLFRYLRNGEEREYRVLRWIQFSSGEGELAR